MTPARHTALGIERDGKRVVTVGGLRDGVYLRADGSGLSTADVEHVVALLMEQATNARLKAQPTINTGFPDVVSPAGA